MWLIGMNVVYFAFGVTLMSLSSWGIEQSKSGITSGASARYCARCVVRCVRIRCRVVASQRGGCVVQRASARQRRPPSPVSPTLPSFRPSAPPPAAVLPAGSLNTLVTVGVFLVILSIVGCAGVRFNYKLGGRYALGFYAFFMVLVMLMEFIAAVSIFTWAGKLDQFSAAQQYKDQGIFVRAPGKRRGGRWRGLAGGGVLW